MTIKPNIFCTLIIIFLVSRIRSQDYIKNKEKYCNSINFLSWQYTAEERTALRLSNKSLISIKFSEIYDFIQNGTISKLITGTIIYLVIIGILLVVTLGSLVMYLLYCCCFEQYKSATITQIKVFCILASVFFVLFIICIILMIIYIAKLQSSYTDSNCAIAKTPYDILEGVKFTNKQFMGLRNLKQTFVYMANEISNLRDVYNQFQSITDKRPNDLSSQADAALTSFSIAAESVQIKDGEGNDNTPLTITSYKTTNRAIIKAEFDMYKEVADALNKAAEKGKNYSNNESITEAKTVLNDSASALTEMITPISTNLDKASTYMSQSATYVALGYYIALALSLCILTISAIMIFIIYCQCAKERCFGMICPLKTCMSVVAAANIALIAISLGIMILSAGLSSFCDFNSSILQPTTSVSAAISESNVNFSEKEKDLYSKCLTTENTYVTTLLSSAGESLSDISEIINGLTMYRIFQPKLTTDTDSITIKALIKIWEKYESGLLYDFDNISTILAELNKQVKCDKIEFRLNSSQCSTANSKYMCKTISSAPAYKVPDCADDPALAQTYFTNLLTHIDQEEKQMGDLIADLVGTDAKTPNIKFKEAKTALISLKTDYSKIEAKVTQTLTIADQYGNGFSNGSDCSAIRETFENLESALCFKFSKEMFYFFIFLLAAILCCIIMNWFICITFRCIPQANTKGSYFEQDNTETSIIVKNKKEE